MWLLIMGWMLVVLAALLLVAGFYGLITQSLQDTPSWESSIVQMFGLAVSLFVVGMLASLLGGAGIVCLLAYWGF
ncbi:MAG: hypothetical protein LBI48_03720 [Burkholderiaceae bacterium]|jgi:hypothetical protein|nr:hypothetical protein [Burkholderiaceae bacterium]